ncbi:MAG: hypothetical protein ABIP49_02595, partial [Lysobacterales bacterium]
MIEAHREWLDGRIDVLRGACASEDIAWPDDAAFAGVLRASLVVSDYAFEQWRRRPALLAQVATACADG